MRRVENYKNEKCDASIFKLASELCIIAARFLSSKPVYEENGNENSKSYRGELRRMVVGMRNLGNKPRFFRINQLIL
jgi:hypothetical protein